MSGRVSYPQLAAMVKELTQRPLTIREMSRIGKVSYMAARFWMFTLHEAKLVRITGYIKTPRTKNGSRLYAWGPGEDVPNTRMSQAERSRRHWAKKRSLDTLWRPVANTTESNDT